MKTRLINTRGQQILQWDVPDQYVAGWHDTSAQLGEIGNTVLNGHHNSHGEVFGRLVDLEVGDQIRVYSSEGIFYYSVNNKMILPEKYQQLNTRMENSRWILPSEDERLTLVTCWPYQTNTHRLIIVAQPDGQKPIDPSY
jgi:sortase A